MRLFCSREKRLGQPAQSANLSDGPEMDRCRPQSTQTDAGQRLGGGNPTRAGMEKCRARKAVESVAGLFLPPAVSACVTGNSFLRLPDLAQPWRDPMAPAQWLAMAAGTVLFFKGKRRI